MSDHISIKKINGMLVYTRLILKLKLAEYTSQGSLVEQNW